MRKIINFFSLVLLIVAISAICWLTSYALENKGIREEVENKVFKNIEVISSNMTDNALSEIFNVYLNDEKHKIKFDYYISIVEGIASIDLIAYLDGKSVLNENVAMGIVADNIEEVFADENVSNYVRLTEKNFKVLNFENNEHLMVDLGFFDKFYKEKYFLISKDAEVLIENGILVRDDSVHFVDVDDKELDIFYSNDYQTLAKVENNAIYVLMLVENNNLYDFKEYKYSYQNGSLVNELLTTYIEIKKINTTAQE